MSLRRTLGILFAVVGALLLALVLYLAFGDLSRHKTRIESLVTQSLGRAFAIDGAFELKVLPEISVRAERIRLGNAPWGSRPQMVEVGRFALDVGLWSLVSGPVDVRSLELSDVFVLLEKDRAGKGNWVFDAVAPEPAAAAAVAAGATEVPAVVVHAKLGNVRVAYREPGKPERAARIETLTIDPAADGLLAIDGKGDFGKYPIKLKGDVGPLGALVAGRDIRMAIQAALADAQIDLKGSVGRLDPLDGADLTLKVRHPDLGALLKDLDLPAVGSGAAQVDARLSDAGELTRLDAEATFDDIQAKVDGTLRSLGLPGSDLHFEAMVANLAKIAAAFDVAGLPAGDLRATGRIAASQADITLDGIEAQFAGAQATADGKIRLDAKPGVSLRFGLASANLAKLRAGLPAVSLAVKGAVSAGGDGIELTELKGRIGENEFAGQASIARAGKQRLEAELSSPRFDLTPLLAQGDAGAAKTKKKKSKYVFSDAPLPLDALEGLDAKLQLAVGELLVAGGSLKDVDASVTVSGGKLALAGNARGGIDGSLQSVVNLAPRGRGAELNLKLVARDLRTGISAGGAFDPADVPATQLDADLRAQGASARQLASGANGRFLLALGPGKVKSGLLGVAAGDLINELFSKLNPFAAEDPYTRLDCVVARTDIVDGQATVNPVLMQSSKVTVVASGDIDLHTESLSLDFSTRPRQGIGISAGMFATPFIQLAGTLASPRLGVGAKGAVAGAAAAATGGMSILAQGAWDRAQGARDLCASVLKEATEGAK